jgi:hypothetical protein
MEKSMENSALVIIELYQIRTGALMRDARAWFVSEFAPQSGKEIVQLLLSGEKQSSYYRMVDYLSQLERLVMKVPNLQKKLENRRTLLERWHQSAAAAAGQASAG